MKIIPHKLLYRIIYGEFVLFFFLHGFPPSFRLWVYKLWVVEGGIVKGIFYFIRSFKLELKINY